MGPKKYFPIIELDNRRPISKLNGCSVHPNVCDIVEWPDGGIECALCARDRQEEYMTPEQRKNPAFHMPPYWKWKPSTPPRDGVD